MVLTIVLCVMEYLNWISVQLKVTISTTNFTKYMSNTVSTYTY